MPVSAKLLQGVAVFTNVEMRVFRRKTGNTLASNRDFVGWLDIGEESERIQVFRSPKNGVSWLREEEYMREKQQMLLTTKVFSSRKGCRPALRMDRVIGHMETVRGWRMKVTFDSKINAWKPVLKGTE